MEDRTAFPRLAVNKRRRVGEVKRERDDDEELEEAPQAPPPLAAPAESQERANPSLRYSKNYEDKMRSKMEVKECQKYFVGGYEISFPFQPYPTQMVMMDKLLRAIREGSNALLESPTGTGKSLSLLCSSLAWQQTEKERILRVRISFKPFTILRRVLDEILHKFLSGV